MKASSNCIELIKHYESLHDGDLSTIGLQPKMCPRGVWTEGYGHAILDNMGRQIKGIANKQLAYAHYKVQTEADAEKQLMADLEHRELQIMELCLGINQNQFDALLSFLFNLGISNLKTSTLLKLARKNPNDFEIAYEFPRWNMAGGKVWPGLTRRRKSEASLYFTGKF